MNCQFSVALVATGADYKGIRFNLVCPGCITFQIKFFSVLIILTKLLAEGELNLSCIIEK